MSLLYYLMAYGGLPVRPDGFFPALPFGTYCTVSFAR